MLTEYSDGMRSQLSENSGNTNKEKTTLEGENEKNRLIKAETTKQGRVSSSKLACRLLNSLLTIHVG